MEEKRKDAFLQQIEDQKTSELFSTLYSALESSKDIYYINYGVLTKRNGTKEDGQIKLNEEGGATITFSNSNVIIQGPVLSEEFFHAYQHENRNGYAMGDFNREFEAKVFATLVGLQYGGYLGYEGMEEFQQRIANDKYNFAVDKFTSTAVLSLPFLFDYIKYANIYSKYNIENSIGDIHYKTPTQVMPISLQEVVIRTY